MPISTTDQLFNLIKSLSKAEKRNFKLYARRTQQTSEARFIRLFDMLDRMDDYTEDVIFKKFKDLSKGQLSNLKRHLYSQVLSSLRLIHIQRNIDIQIHEQIDFAHILYGKGLYMQSLKLLNRIKGIARESHRDILHYEILEFEKLIEEKHITRSRTIKDKVENLIEESEDRNRVLNSSNQLTNLKLKIHGLYIKIGHVRNEKDAFIVKDYFRSNLPIIQEDRLTFFEKIYLHQSYVWYYYILLDFEKCLDHSRKWTQLFEDNPNMMNEDPDLFMRGLHYILTSLYSLDEGVTHRNGLAQFKAFIDQYGGEFNTTSNIISFLYYTSALFNQHQMEGSFDEGLALIPDIEDHLKKYERHLDSHRILVFNYRTAWLYFGSGKFGEAIDYLNEIINLKAGHLREDIQCYARLLHLLAHFEMGNYALLEYLEKSVSRYFEKMKDHNQVQLEVLSFIRRQLKSSTIPDPKLLQSMLKTLQSLQKDAFEKRSFIYLDAIAWVKSKQQGKHVQDVIREECLTSNDRG
ncbi:MAG: hypothetical protein OEQ53_01525 [Saprospiraceae bacterium]|nr:hypothetical protein [Saprospiraceae bacterium]